MTHRELGICRAILTYLHDLDGGQAQEINIHAGASEKFMALIPKSELDRMFALCANTGWLRNVPTKFKGMLWSITPSGEKTLQEMNE